MSAAQDTRQATDFREDASREITPLSLWGGDTLVYRSILALAIIALPLVGIARWLTHGTPWSSQLTLAAVVFAGALGCYALSERGMRDTAAALMIGIIWLGATIFALGTGFGIHSSVIYLYVPCLLYGVLFFGVTFASIELVLTIAALLLMYWAEAQGAIGGLRAFIEHSSNLNYLIGIVATCVGTLVVGVVYHRRVASEAARVVTGAEKLKQAVESAHDAQAQLQTAHAKLQHLNDELSRHAEDREREMARAMRDIGLYHDAMSREFPASMKALRKAIETPDEQTEARLQRELTHMETVAGTLAGLGRGLPVTARNPVALSSLAHEEALRLREQREFAKVRFEVDPGLKARGDEQLLATLLRGLLGRAARACSGETEPLVHVGSGSLEGRAMFFVHDNGTAKDGAPQLAVRDSVEIGIASAQGIVERHGGELVVDARPGRGTTVYFSLPA